MGCYIWCNTIKAASWMSEGEGGKVGESQGVERETDKKLRHIKGFQLRDFTKKLLSRVIAYSLYILCRSNYCDQTS